MNPGDLVTFSTCSREREVMPALHESCVGRPIEFTDAVGVMRVVSGDRVRLVEIRDNYALVSHTALKGALLLAPLEGLKAIAAELKQPIDHQSEEDQKL